MNRETGEWVVTKAPLITLTIEGSAWRYFANSLNCTSHLLLLTWEPGAPGAAPRWFVTDCAKTSIPRETINTSFVTKLDGLTVVVPQKQRLADLNDRALCFNGKELVLG